MDTQHAGKQVASRKADAGRRGMVGPAVKGAASAAAVSLVAAGAAGASAAPLPQVAAAPGMPVACPTRTTGETPLAFVKVHNVQGKFSYSQDVVTPTEQIAHDLRGVGHVLTHAEAPAVAPTCPTPAEDPLAWRLSVKGCVDAPFVATLGELAQAGTASAVMSYTCMNNPSDGRATANASTTGVTLASLLSRAGVHAGANAVTFVSADGYEISLPLDYVTEHAAMIAYRLNGEPLARSVGSTNQLWLSGASAHYFVRDVQAIRVSKVSDADIPPVPGSPASGDQFRNRPNVGVLGGYSIA